MRRKYLREIESGVPDTLRVGPDGIYTLVPEREVEHE